MTLPPANPNDTRSPRQKCVDARNRLIKQAYAEHKLRVADIWRQYNEALELLGLEREKRQ